MATDNPACSLSPEGGDGQTSKAPEGQGRRQAEQRKGKAKVKGQGKGDGEGYRRGQTCAGPERAVEGDQGCEGQR